uniref:Uncharacterized protein n=1 Tax=Mucochytrium quahogii TaxID=96639 RepID=A0A7S2REH9_9STRA|mmetsp:Transcript_8204/g.13251  ORF Transcript_8204/g.13251 Transcript_8204/m.13251 type:complete len:440 (+) Transcript_8204:116-1435(+)
MDEDEVAAICDVCVCRFCNRQIPRRTVPVIDNDKYFVHSDLLWQYRAGRVLRGESKVPHVFEEMFPINDDQEILDEKSVVPSMVSTFNSQLGNKVNENAQVVFECECNVLSARFIKLNGDLVVVSGSADKRVRICDPKTQQLLAELEFQAPVIFVRPRHSHDDTVLVGTMDGKVSLAKVHSSDSEVQIESSDENVIPHAKLISAVVWSPCGEWFATAGRDNKVHIYQVCGRESPKLVNSLTCSGVPEAISFVVCFGFLALAVAIRDENCLEYVMVSKAPSEGDDLKLSPGDLVKANMNDRGDAHVSFAVLDLCAAPGGLPMIAAATDKNRIIVFKTGTSEQYRNLYGHSCSEYSRPKICWSPSAEFVLSTSDVDTSVFVWSIASGENVMILKGHGASVRDVSICTKQSDEGESFHGDVLTCSFDKTIRVWKGIHELKTK